MNGSFQTRFTRRYMSYTLARCGIVAICHAVCCEGYITLVDCRFLCYYFHMRMPLSFSCRQREDMPRKICYT